MILRNNIIAVLFFAIRKGRKVIHTTITYHIAPQIKAKKDKPAKIPSPQRIVDISHIIFYF